MKAFNVVLKVLAALVVVAGILYVVATYGDKIVAWAKRIWAKFCICEDAEVISEVCESEPADEEAEPIVREEDFEC